MDDVSPVPRTAAIYVRASTDLQQYSTEHQAKAIREYAAKNNFAIIKEFQDNGKSGLQLSGRAGLQELLREVQSGDAGFQNILVHDVSRWGRFQDVDESAYYEFLCKRSRVAVHYCSEPFDDQDSASTAVFKALKRSMAGEYSRELSKKVFAGQSHLIELGYRTGGPAGFGLRRQVVDREGNSKGILRAGERKGLITDRVILIPGPEEEVQIVREIFDLFINQPISESKIARILNARGIKTDTGRSWQKWSIHNLLRNPKYTGCNVYGRTSFRLGMKRYRKPAESWTRHDGAFQPIVSRSQFELAQQVIRRKAERVSDERLLESLRDLLKRKGSLSSRIIREDDKTLTVRTYIERFGTLTAAYERVGYKNQYSRHGSVKMELKRRLEGLCERLKADLISLGASVEQLGAKNYWRVNHQFSVQVTVCYCGRNRDKSRWQICPPGSKHPDLSIIARMDRDNEQIIDYFALPHLDRGKKRTCIGLKPNVHLDVYRFDSLDFFLDLTRRSCALHFSERPTEKQIEVIPNAAKACSGETPMQRALVDKAVIIGELLNILAATWRRLCKDRNFITLLRAENSILVPKVLANLEARQFCLDSLAAARKTYGTDVLVVTVIGRYLEALMANVEVERFVKQNYASVKRDLDSYVTWIKLKSGRTVGRNNDLARP